MQLRFNGWMGVGPHELGSYYLAILSGALGVAGISASRLFMPALLPPSSDLMSLNSCLCVHVRWLAAPHPREAHVPDPGHFIQILQGRNLRGQL